MQRFRSSGVEQKGNLQSYEGLSKLVVTLMLEHCGVQFIDQFGLDLLEVLSVGLELSDQIIEAHQNAHSQVLLGAGRIEHVAAILGHHLKWPVQAFDVGHCSSLSGRRVDGLPNSAIYCR